MYVQVYNVCTYVHCTMYRYTYVQCLTSVTDPDSKGSALCLIQCVCIFTMYVHLYNACTSVQCMYIYTMYAYGMYNVCKMYVHMYT